MTYELLFTDQADADLDSLDADSSLAKRLKAVRKALAFLETNPRHPGVNTHKFSSLKGPGGEEVFRPTRKTRLLPRGGFSGITGRTRSKSRTSPSHLIPERAYFPSAFQKMLETPLGVPELSIFLTSAGVISPTWPS